MQLGTLVYRCSEGTGPGQLPSFFKVIHTQTPPNRKKTRNAPSAGTKRIDRIEKCHSGLRNSVVFSSKTVLLLLISQSVHDILTRLCTSTFYIWNVALLHVISCARCGTVSYRLRIVIRKILPWSSCYTVYCTMGIEGRRHSWRILRGNGGMGDVWRGG